jgi:tRNA (cytidine/uridine-2'-O-)-methyltransferase
MRIALYQPDIPQNTGTILRLAACLSVDVDVILPAGFDLTDRALRRAGLDYLQHVQLTRHAEWDRFLESTREAGNRIVLLTTKAEQRHVDFSYQKRDVLLLGRETSGVPEHVHAACDARVRIPLIAGVRSLNVAVAAAMVLGEALRQTEGYPA